MTRWACLVLLFVGSTWAQSPKEQPKPAEPEKGTEVTIAGLKSTAPPTWMSQKPANRLRLFQFKLPKATDDKEDAELFALEMHGKPADNLSRLKELFVLPADVAREKVVKETKLELKGAALTVLDIQGTYLVKTKPIDQAVKETRPDYRMIAVLWESKEGGYTIRLIGPRKTIERHAASFVDWLKNFK